MAASSTGIEKHRFDIGLEDLQTFLAVADVGSFSRAAERLNLSQPSISNRVRRLEEKLHVRLLSRTTRRVELTEPGRRLYLQSSEALSGLRSLLSEFALETASRTREVKVAATPMVAASLALLLRGFQEANPSITASLSDLTPVEAMSRVSEGRCDMAVMVMSKPRPNLVFQPLLSDPCVVVTPLGHPLLQREAAPLAEVLNYPLLSADGHADLRRMVLARAEERGLTVRLSPEGRGVQNSMTLLAMAAAGLGVCIHQRSFIPNELKPTIGIVPLADCEIVRTFGLVTAEGQPLSPPARRFAEFLRTAMVGATDGLPNAPPQAREASA